MPDTQLYIALGIPTLAVLVGILINSMQFHRATASINARLTSVETRLDLLPGKVMDFDGRLTRPEERGDRRP
jgi:hypothetical protein